MNYEFTSTRKSYNGVTIVFFETAQGSTTRMYPGYGKQNTFPQNIIDHRQAMKWPKQSKQFMSTGTQKLINFYSS